MRSEPDAPAWRGHVDGAPSADRQHVSNARSRFDYIEVVLAKIARRVERDDMFAGSVSIGVAVSGGADSVALLHALQQLLPDRSLSAVHLNHRLRGSESDLDEEFVRGLAEGLGLRVFVRRQDVAEAAGSVGGNLEQAGRQCRYDYFRQLISDGACDVVATAHTRSDQAETVLFRLLRGSGGNGLSAIWPVRRPGIVRPMLDVSRSEVLDYLRCAGLSWREDASNADPGYARNRLRHSLLPLLGREWNPNVEGVLSNTADWALEEERYWGRRVAELQERCVREDSVGLLLDVEAARAIQVAEQRRLVDAILRRPQFCPGRAGFEHIEAVRDLIRSPAGSGALDLPGVRAERSFGEILFVPRSGDRPAEFDLPLLVPGLARLPGEPAASVRTRLLGAPSGETLYNTGDSAFLDWDRVPRLLRVRNWQAGDRYRPVGQNASRKIRDLFRRSRVSAWRRAGWPVVTASNDAVEPGRIVWARQFGPAQELIATASSRHVLALDELYGSDAT